MHTRSLATRRRLVTALALVAWLPDVQAQAQNKLERVGLFGLLGDSMQVVVATDAPSDTRIERSARHRHRKLERDQCVSLYQAGV